MGRLRKVTSKQYAMEADRLAEFLIGAVLVRHVGGKRLRARIVEAEAYMGPVDLASHSSKGRTARTAVMFGEAGRAYVYLIYGMYWMFNIVAGTRDSAHAVLIRAGEPLDGWEADLSGPGKLARAMKIGKTQNGIGLGGREISVWKDAAHRPRIERTARIGIDYARHWKEALLRFSDAHSAAVSGR